MTEQLVTLPEVEHLLACITTVKDASAVRRAASAMQRIAKLAGMSLEEQNRAAEAKIRAEWVGGGLLNGMPRGEPGRPEKGNTVVTISAYQQAVTEAGLSFGEAARWQRIAEFGEDRLNELMNELRRAKQEITTGYVLRAWRRELKNNKPDEDTNARAIESLDELVGRQFGTIYADPPWLYGNQGTRGATGDHYPGMTVEEIAALPIGDFAAPQSHLHLWTTNAFLFDAKQIIEAWGFTYKSCFVWVKPQIGMGNYWRVSHEFLLLGVRNSAPFGSRSERSWQEWRRGKHSAKPERMYELLERVSPGPYLELFARMARPGWTSWGNQVGRDLFSQEAA